MSRMRGKLYLLILAMGLIILAMCLLKDAGNPVPRKPAIKNPYAYIGIRTPYSYIHNDTGRAMIPTNCKPMQIWIMCRHGTRYPSKFTIEQILNLTHIRNRIMTDDRYEIRAPLYVKKDLTNWKPSPELVLSKGEYLAMQGEKDLASLAERLRAKLPLLFGGNVTKSFKFRSTAKQRTIASMRAFIKGAFDIRLEEIAPIVNDTLSQFESMDIQRMVTIKITEGAFSNASIELEVLPIAEDIFSKLYASCESWKSIVVTKEVDAFINGPEMTKVLTNVSWRLGLSNNISKEDVFLFYNTCLVERTLHPNESSPWCDVFTNNEIRVLEYGSDLYYYYCAGPGQEINSMLGCYAIRDMLDHFAKLEVDGNDEPTGVFYFAHSTFMILFLTTMGIGKDSVPLTAANFREMDRRNWRSSLLIPYAANFMAIFHRCDSSDASSKIAFYLNENPLTLEGCENGICDWPQLKKKLSAIAAECNAKVCQKKM